MVASSKEQAVRIATAWVKAQAALPPPTPGLPPLKGTAKQVAWAKQIREQFAKVTPSDIRLMQRDSTAWWIENRLVLTARSNKK